MQKARGHPSKLGLPQLVSTWFQVLFTPLIGVLFIIQSPYWFTIGRRVVFSLTGWAPHVRTEFHELRATQERLGLRSQQLQDFHLLRSIFPDRSLSITLAISAPIPQAEAWFGLFRFRSPLLTESRLLSFPLATEMCQFARFAPTPYAFRCR